MTTFDELPVRIEEYSIDGKTLFRPLAKCANAAIALGAFPAARGLCPKGRVMVRQSARVIADSADLDRPARRQKSGEQYPEKR